MPGDPPAKKANWFEEFKKVNASNPGSSSSSRSVPVPPAAPTQTASTSNAGEKPADRRRHARFEIEDCQIEVFRDGVLKILGKLKGNQARAALDLSEGGLRIQTTERIPVGTRVRVVLQVEKYKDQIEASGEVRWCFQSAKNAEDFYAGIQFSELEPAQARKIALMREWFTSTQYRAVRDAKKKKGGSSVE